jgi:hypothetical protein
MQDIGYTMAIENADVMMYPSFTMCPRYFESAPVSNGTESRNMTHLYLASQSLRDKLLIMKHKIQRVKRSGEKCSKFGYVYLT